MIGRDSTAGAARAADAQLVLALACQPGLTVGELADQTGLAPGVVRSILRDLGRRALAWRPVTGPGAGRWRLTSRGAAELEPGQRARSRA